MSQKESRRTVDYHPICRIYHPIQPLSMFMFEDDVLENQSYVENHIAHEASAKGTF